MTSQKDLIKLNDWVYVPTVMGYPKRCKKSKSTGKKIGLTLNMWK